MNYILFDDNTVRTNLLPLTFLRPVADVRIGILTIREKWEKMLGVPTSSLTESHLAKKFPIVKEENNVLINGAVCPNEEIIGLIQNMKPHQTIVHADTIIAMHVTAKELEDTIEHTQDSTVEEIDVTQFPLKILYPWDIFTKNSEAIQADFELITKGRKSQKLSATNTVIGDGKIFLEKGAVVEGAILNAKSGPIYIGADAEIMEGATIRGPFALCDHATVKMQAKMYGPTTIGPHCKVGGEINNSVLFAYSNKAHDGFLGHSVIAEWCNLGADTNTSNLKNTYDSIKLWSYRKQTFVDTCQQFCGLIMGDHSKTGIDTMFNSGTVVGVNVNVFGAGFQRNFIPSFTWGGTTGYSGYDLNKAIEVAKKMYERRGLEMDETERTLLSSVHRLTAKNRWM
jgi:UDP-N-acetylglucosamine diphosphorylase/glucosamine-1-phosphate N-acetyltransferase